MGSSGIHYRRNRTLPVWVRSALLCCGLLSTTLAAIPVQGADPSDTFYGTGALANVTSGFFDSAFGYYALYNNTDGSYNTTNGAYALYSNTTGNYNTANGAIALFYNTTGYSNTASGYATLYSSNTTGIRTTTRPMVLMRS